MPPLVENTSLLLKTAINKQFYANQMNGVELVCSIYLDKQCF